MRTAFLPPLALACVAACALQAPAPPPVIVPQAIEAPAAPDPKEPLVLPRSESVARWRERPFTERPKRPFDRVTLVEAGQKGAILLTNAHEYVAVSEERGAIGPLAIPTVAKWVGTDDHDRIYAATPSGKLFVAETPEEAAAGKMVETGEVKDASDWDFSAGTVAAIAGERVFVSTDRGATFTSTTPKRGSLLDSVFVRFDGAILVRLVPALRSKAASKNRRAEHDVGDVYLSRDRGKTWQRSSYTPSSIRRDGAWIWNGSEACPAVLTADGRGFTVDRAAYEAFSELRTWTTMLGASDEPGGHPLLSRLRVTSPLPPASTTGKGREAPSSCDGPGLLLTGMGEGELALSGYGTGHGGKCAGIACLAGTVDRSIEPTWLALELLHDGACKDAAPNNEDCAPGAPFTRAPKYVTIDQRNGAIRIGTLPSGCNPERLWSVGGLGLLFCKGTNGGAVIHTSEPIGHWSDAGAPAGPWANEGTIAVPTKDIFAATISHDGTLMLHVKCPKDVPCRAVVRAPKASGDTAAWRVVAAPDAITYRVVDGGGALAIARADGDRRLSVVLSPASGEATTLVQAVDVGTRNLYSVRVDDGGHVVLAGSDGKGPSESWLVTVGGMLVANPEDAAKRAKASGGVPRE